MHSFRCSHPHSVLVPVATEATSSWQPASNCFSSALSGSQLPPQGFPTDPSELDQCLLTCNLKCEGFKSRWGEHLTSEKERTVNKDFLLFKPMGCSGRSPFLSNQVPEQKLHLTAFSDSLFPSLLHPPCPSLQFPEGKVSNKGGTHYLCFRLMF